MYLPSSSYTFISRTQSDSSTHQYHHHHLTGNAPPSDLSPHSTNEQYCRRPRATPLQSQRCDLHHSIAQLYLRTLPSNTSLPDETIQTKRKSRRSSSKTSVLSVPGNATDLSKSPPGAGTFYPDKTFLQSQAQSFPALSTDDSCSSSSSSSAKKSIISSTHLRSWLASSMSTMYKSEVPLYGDLISIISTVNSNVITSQPASFISDAEISRLSVERHGAIRVGTQEELSILARIFKLFAMQPVGYYDLWKHAGLPIHATAFRPVAPSELEKNPFRIFCSLLRLELVRDPETHKLAEKLLAQRQIFSNRCLELLGKMESSMQTSGRIDVPRQEALEFVDTVVDIFKWHSDTPVSVREYQQLHSVHPLVADIVCFRGPHINHLTPRTLDIDDVQRTMVERGIDAKEIVEGPPRRVNPIYLRQTSFHALSEQVSFLADDGIRVGGKHKARFGEIEARGQSLTRRGAALYDECMATVAGLKRQFETERGGKLPTDQYEQLLQAVFAERFPDDLDQIRRDGLGYFSYSVKDPVLAQKIAATSASKDEALLRTLLESGAVQANPIIYEDFLPASAAGIFQSNLPQFSSQKTSTSDASAQSNAGEEAEKEAQARLEKAVGGVVLDYFELYKEQQLASLREVASQLALDSVAVLWIE
ncbi:DUF1338-domain-containing protein [Testicularia cyperi]|uniref:2-oxoadipate dioxygenase/decarboxylase n=1 Tax=Testicularia cyperi TaxID=1882483 RepID=A0A317XZK1_9BASI|nr:DUF1338-domain-containing protein [Testicularia cyperi]